MSCSKPVRLNLAFLFLFIAAVACKSEPKEDAQASTEDIPSDNVVEVVTRSMEFFAPDTLKSGWNTFVYENRSTEPHFILLDKYPEGKTYEDTKKEVIPPFDKGMELIIEGKNDEAMEAFGGLPEWFSQIVFSGGTGLISAGETAVSTVNLEPGYYVMECYVKMPDGKFHVSMGMAKPIIVTQEDSGLAPPEADVALTLSSESGIDFNGNIPPGENVFSVTYQDQVVHEHFMGHDVNLVRMEEGADLQALEAWMNWATPDGLTSSTLPEGFTFVGGTNDAPAGSTQYFEVLLTPGSYAFISEVPNASEKGMLKPFEVVIE